MKLSSFYRALIFTIILLSTPSPIFSAQQSGEKIRPGDIVKHTSSFAVYKINEDGTKSVFPHESVFKSYGYADFNGIKTTDLSRTPSTAPVAFRDGTLLRAQKKNIFGQDTTTVFVVEKGELRPIVSADVYQSLYHDPQWERVVWIPNDLISKFNYSIGNTWVDPSTPPMGTVIKTNTGYYIIDKEDSTYIKRKLEPRAVTANRISAMPIVRTTDSKISHIPQKTTISHTFIPFIPHPLSLKPILAPPTQPQTRIPDTPPPLVLVPQTPLISPIIAVPPPEQPTQLQTPTTPSTPQTPITPQIPTTPATPAGLSDSEILTKLSGYASFFSAQNDTATPAGQNPFAWHIGTGAVLITAPHAVTHIRDGSEKMVDYCTGPMARILGDMTGAPVLYQQYKDQDPNYYDNTQFKNEMSAYFAAHPDIKLVFDIHGASETRSWDIDFGTMNGASLPHYPNLISTMTQTFKDNGITTISLNDFSGGSLSESSQKTVTRFAVMQGKDGVQLEINRKYRCDTNAQTISALRAIASTINQYK